MLENSMSLPHFQQNRRAYGQVVISGKLVEFTTNQHLTGNVEKSTTLRTLPHGYGDCPIKKAFLLVCEEKAFVGSLFLHPNAKN